MSHRLLELVQERSQTTTGVSAGTMSGWVVCPCAMGNGMMDRLAMWQEVYRLAREQAEAVAKPSRLERLQVAFSN